MSRAVTPEFWSNRRVLLTGHTGFKGAWLSLWLQTLGAEVTGVSLAPPTVPSLYEVARVGEGMSASFQADVRDPQALAAAFAQARPEVVVHMAAQPLVRRSYEDPTGTFETNVMGTANVLDATRRSESVRVVLTVTSDKCYENREDGVAFREGDPLGGHDPYSASKAAAELVTHAYRRSFFDDPDGARVASARAGNVIGGGDWGRDRLIADVMRAALAGEVVELRNPRAVRPWQHALCPLSGYLRLVEALWDSPRYADAWNFGPAKEDERTVEWVVRRVSELWPQAIAWASDRREHEERVAHPREAIVLRLDSSRARDVLGWRPAMTLEQALEATVAWWQAQHRGENMRAVTLAQIQAFDEALAGSSLGVGSV